MKRLLWYMKKPEVFQGDINENGTSNAISQVARNAHT